MLIRFTSDRFGKLFQSDRPGSSLTWEEWRVGADKAFEEVADASPWGSSGAIGFKLMYNQVRAIRSISSIRFATPRSSIRASGA